MGPEADPGGAPRADPGSVPRSGCEAAGAGTSGLAGTRAGRDAAAGAVAAGRKGEAGGGTAVGVAVPRLLTRRDGGGAPPSLAVARAGSPSPSLGFAERASAGPLSAALAGDLRAGALAGALRAGGSEAGSSGWTGRRSPSASAFLLTRSAWASSIEEEWLFTPMPSDRQRSSASLFVSPSSRPSS